MYCGILNDNTEEGHRVVWNIFKKKGELEIEEWLYNNL